MKRWAALCFLLGPLAEAQTAPVMEKSSDTAAVLALMKGQVDLYGDQFGSVQFQRGILALLQQKTITVRVLTTLKSAPNMRPLKALGAKINTLDSQFTGSLVVVQGRAVILPGKPGGYVIMRGQEQVVQLQNLMQPYWQLAGSY